MRLVTALFVLLVSPALPAQPFPVERVFPNLTFSFPTDLQHAGDGSDRLFVAEQGGLVKVFPNDPGVGEATVFLDLTDRVLVNDRFGLLGLAFHPDYAANGYLYVHYTAAGPNRSVIARFTVSADPNVADPASELVILEVEQPHRFHNGGALAFGPDDGYLYIPLGDGGPGGDPNGHGQNRETLLGTMLRLDVANSSGGLNYAIPADNPFAGNTQGWREEIWAWGFRNTWRASFDPATGRLWGAENGEDRWEELNVIEAGKNYGWKTMEGEVCFSPPSGCDMTGLELPVWTYGGTSDRRSVIGGYVYHGQQTPELEGLYIYGDWLRGNVWSLAYDGVNPPTNTLLAFGQNGVTTFGLDEAGELYFLRSTGGVYHFVPTSTANEPPPGPSSFRVYPPAPNPSSGEVALAVELRDPAQVTVTVLDVLGRTHAVPLHGRQGAGRHRVVWDGRDASGRLAPPGLYLYRVQVGEAVQTPRFVRVR